MKDRNKSLLCPYYFFLHFSIFSSFLDWSNLPSSISRKSILFTQVLALSLFLVSVRQILSFACHLAMFTCTICFSSLLITDQEWLFATKEEAIFFSINIMKLAAFLLTFAEVLLQIYRYFLLNSKNTHNLYSKWNINYTQRCKGKGH